jgi:hypothetical protein
MLKKVLIVMSLGLSSLYCMQSTHSASNYRAGKAFGLRNKQQEDIAMIAAAAIVEEINPNQQNILIAIHQTLCGMTLLLEQNNAALSTLDTRVQRLEIFSRYNGYGPSGCNLERHIQSRVDGLERDIEDYYQRHNKVKFTTEKIHAMHDLNLFKTPVAPTTEQASKNVVSCDSNYKNNNGKKG